MSLKGMATKSTENASNLPLKSVGGFGEKCGGWDLNPLFWGLFPF